MTTVSDRADDCRPDNDDSTPAEESGRIDPQRLDPAVVAALYAEYAGDLRAFLLGVLKNADLAAEALQATFARTMERGHTARDETLKGWLFRVAFTEAMALRRRQKLHERSVRRIVAERRGGNDRHAAPHDDLCRWETVEQVKAVLERLPEEQRRVVRMRIYEEKTFAVIAEELGMPLGTVLTRMRLALKKLAGHLDRES